MEGYLFSIILVVLFALYPGYGSHTAPRYDFGSYDGLFLSHDDIRELKYDFENMMPGTIKKSQTEWMVSSSGRDRDSDCDNDFSSEEGDNRRFFNRRNRGTCSSCCETQWKATNIMRVSYNGTQYNVVRGRDQYQVVFQGVCPSRRNSCGGVKCEEDDSFFYPVLVERQRDFFNATHRYSSPYSFVPIRVSRSCRCMKGHGM